MRVPHVPAAGPCDPQARTAGRRWRIVLRMRRAAVCLAALGLAFLSVPAAGATQQPAGPLYAVAYGTGADLMRVVGDGRSEIVRVIPHLHVAVVRSNVRDFANDTRDVAGVRYVERVVTRRLATDPALFSTTSSGTPYEW